ncbi:MAG: four helix bundle protein [Acidobacteria bacterium]|nr:MAG: four helix bundle protein [Acidobacteriota bacterium]
MKNSFRNLFVWEASVDLAVRMIGLADDLVARKRFAIADQLVRAALSVPSNIAEGEGRTTDRDRRHYLVQARGSLYEVETQLEVIMRCGLASDLNDTRTLIAKIGSGLTKMIDHRTPLSP